MKEITREKTITEVMGYQADDGSWFYSKEECEKYEKSSEFAIISAFNKMVIKETRGAAFMDNTFYPACDGRIVAIELKTMDDVIALNKVLNMCNRSQDCRGSESVGEKLLMEFIDGEVWVMGTLESEKERVCKYLDSLFVKKEEN